MSKMPHDERVSTKNPFFVEYPDPDRVSPKLIVDTFVENHTPIGPVKHRRHTFIWGSRGSGKSMILRYIEPQCQFIVHGSPNIFLVRPGAFIALYCRCKEGHLNQTELRLLDDATRIVIVEHMLNLLIADRLAECLRTQFPLDFFNPQSINILCKRILALFDKASIASSVQEANETCSMEADGLLWLQSLYFAENKKVANFLRHCSKNPTAYYAGATSGYHDFLLPLMKAVQQLPGLEKVPFYVMLDDAHKLTREQQSLINTWIANRDHATLCLKVSAQREGYKTFYTRDNALIEQIHDYSEVDIDELYTGARSDYGEKVKLICERRLQITGVATKDIASYLPPDPEEHALLERIRTQTAQEWITAGKPGRQNDYITRYSIPRLFQHLRETKKRKSYAGFRSMVDLSSGVVRNFLEPCYLMFDKCEAKGLDPKTLASIPPAIQDEVLFKFSEEFLLQKFDEIRKDVSTEKSSKIDALYRLIASLGKLFYERLHDPEAREARLFSFTIRGDTPPDLEEVLQFGVLYRYFQLRTYSRKEGGGRERWYILNRRLCPVFKLDPSGFEGRISLTADYLRLACEDPDTFVRLRLKRSDDAESQLDMFELEESVI